VSRSLKVAVVGATGAVGQALISILDSRKFPVAELLPFASKRSVGREISFQGRTSICRVLTPGCFDNVDLAFFDASDAVSQEWVPQAILSGAWVVDNSAAFRMDPKVPLVVPEVNGSHLTESDRLLAGPNCSTVQLVVALKSLSDRWGLKRVVVSTYKITRGAGIEAMAELSSQTLARLSGQAADSKAFVHPIAFNCIPQIGSFKNDYTGEETKIMEESRKILGLPELKITATAIRVPTLHCHGESVNVECMTPFKISDVRQAWTEQAGLVIQDDPSSSVYPMGIDAVGKDYVGVGRIRRDESVDNGLNFWVVSDNLRKGAALNAVQIGESVLQWIQAKPKKI
jgi:aspartate-semialdehyde dehydrogenase